MGQGGVEREKGHRARTRDTGRALPLGFVLPISVSLLSEEGHICWSSSHSSDQRLSTDCAAGKKNGREKVRRREEEISQVSGTAMDYGPQNTPLAFRTWGTAVDLASFSASQSPGVSPTRAGHTPLPTLADLGAALSRAPSLFPPWVSSQPAGLMN